MGRKHELERIGTETVEMLLEGSTGYKDAYTEKTRSEIVPGGQ